MAEHKKRDTLTKDLEASIRIIKLSISFGVCCLLLTYFAFRWIGDTSFTLDAAVWGALGDFFGGILNPFFSILTIYLLVKSLRLQNQELSDATDQLSQTRKIHEHSLMYEDTREVFKRRATAFNDEASYGHVKVYPPTKGEQQFIVNPTSNLADVKVAISDEEALKNYLSTLNRLNGELYEYARAGLDLLGMGTPTYLLRDTMTQVHGVIELTYSNAKCTNHHDLLHEGYELYSELIKKSKVRFFL